MSNENVADGDVRRKGGLGQRIAYACGNLGQAAFYNAMSTYFVTYVTKIGRASCRERVSSPV